MKLAIVVTLNVMWTFPLVVALRALALGEAALCRILLWLVSPSYLVGIA